ncbi:baseplate J/gp47 family protein [Shewanella baltica]|uniref:Putative bacteriophage protein n=1 Tax=Shewanella baltica (strain OS155 / ATCC BAA-1091) TaxID=325240 RepID=A3D255_SHEB5|nr:baseplate J/gp47 family protein [Shewanella baltica]ABN60818.1 putative bacteriophage protein [Shewanella baltica OS155]AEH13168.1 putative bacteriophage protein [Shewanella baltica OS117]
MADKIDVPTIDFAKIVEAAGIPTTEEGWKALFKQDVEAEGSIIANDSPYSPFWRLITAIIAKPATWIVNKVLIGVILPNLFLLTANDDGFIEAKAWEHDLTRKTDSKAKGKVRFNRAASSGPSLLIPAATVIQTDAINGTVYRVLTVDDVILPQNSLSVLVPVIAENAGAAYNLGAGYLHILPTAVTGIGSVTNEAEWLDELGSDRETNDDLKLRTRNAFTAAAPWHIDAVYRAILTERAGLDTDNIYFEHDAPRGPGTANAYILLDTGEPSAAMLTDLNQYVMEKGYHGHGDDLLVLAMPGVDVTVGVTVYPYSYLLEAEVVTLLADIENFIRCAFRENTDYTATRTEPFIRFSFSKLGQELHRQFAGIESLNWHQIDITSANNVPRLSTLTIENGNEL